jgi:gluconate 2-dehydrogenase gamma chain
MSAHSNLTRFELSDACEDVASTEAPVCPAASGKTAGQDAPRLIPTTSTEPVYIFFNLDEAVFVEAAIDALIPSDKNGPGALELGVAVYVDRQMLRARDHRRRMYRDERLAGIDDITEPIEDRYPELMRAGIAGIQYAVYKKYNKSFAALSHAQRVAILTGLDAIGIDLPTVPLAAVFALLLQLTVEGYLADYGQNGDEQKADWQMKGFPGSMAVQMWVKHNARAVPSVVRAGAEASGASRHSVVAQKPDAQLQARPRPIAVRWARDPRNESLSRF